VFDMETSLQEVDGRTCSQDQETLAVSMAIAVRNGGEEPQQEIASKTPERVAAYIRHRSLKMAAKECGITEGRMREVLTAERDRRGLTDMRLLYAGDESEFNAGGKDVIASELLSLAESQSFRCALTGIRLTPESSSLDHIVPVSDGGSHEIDNLQWVDRRINAMKRDMPVDEFIELCRLVAKHASVDR
jgi:hypothetical protein